MQINRHFKYFRIALMVAGVAIATSAPQLFPANISKNLANTSQLTENSASFSTSLLKLNNTWASDVWNETQGYYYTPNTAEILEVYGTQPVPLVTQKENWTFKLTSDGFAVNPIGPHYANLKQINSNSWYTSKPGNPWGATDFFKQDLILDSYSYNDNQYIQNAEQKSAMEFNYRFRKSLQMDSINIDISKPFINIRIPSIYYQTHDRTIFTGSSAGSPDINKYSVLIGINESHTSRLNWESVDADSSAVPSYDWGVNSQYAWNKNSTISTKDGTMSYTLTQNFSYITYTNISMYKDYDGSELKGIHMTKNGSSFNTTYDSLTIDEKILDKTNQASSNISKLSEILTVNGSDIGYNFIRDGTYTATADDNKGELKVNFTPKHAFVDGKIVAYTGPALEKTIGGFTISITEIIKISGHPTNIVVDKWKITVVDERGLVTNRNELGKYLDLSTVPATAKIYLVFDSDLSKVYDYKKGTVSFGVYSSEVMITSGGTLGIESPLFPITLTLTPRVTKMVPVTSGYPKNLTSAVLKSRLFDDTGLVKDPVEFEKYISIKVPAEGAKYYLVKDSWVPHTGDGTVKFDIYADKYYDSEGNQKSSSVATAGNKASFNLTLQPEVSTIALKSNLPEIRIDKFKTYIESAGTKVEGSKLGEFFDLTNIPSTATFSIANVDIDAFDVNFARKHLTFDLIIDKFNKGSPATPQTYAHNYELTLGTQHQPTAITAKTHDKTIRVDKVANELNTLKDKALVTYLSNFLYFTSIPDEATISVKNVLPNENTGKLSFEVVPSQIYNSTSDLVNPTDGRFTFSLQFDVKYPPTSITLNSNYPADTSVVDFVDNVLNLTNQALYDYLVTDYLTAISVHPDTIVAEILDSNYSSGNVKFKVTVPSYYDINSNLINESLNFIFELSLIPKYTETNIVAWDEKLYPKDLSVDKFKISIIQNSIAEDGGYLLSPANILLLDSYIDFNSIPPNSTYILIWNNTQTDVDSGFLAFSISVNHYYNVQGIFVNAPKTFDLSLRLAQPGVIPGRTMLTTHPNSPEIGSEQEFLEMVYRSPGVINRDNLSLFVAGLQTMPSGAQVLDIVLKKTQNSITLYTVKISAYYDGVTPEVHNEEITFEFQIRIRKDMNNSIYQLACNWWIWLIVAILVGFILWFLFICFKRREQSSPSELDNAAEK